MKPLFKREPKLIGVGVEKGPGFLVNDGNETRLSPFAADLEHLAVHGFPGGRDQFKNAYHPPHREAEQGSVAISGIVAKAHLWNGFKKELEFCWTQCLWKRDIWV